jgi:hypothetical protein
MFAGWRANDKLRHCERSEAIQSRRKNKAGLLRRFAPRNDDKLTTGLLNGQMT